MSPGTRSSWATPLVVAVLSIAACCGPVGPAHGAEPAAEAPQSFGSLRDQGIHYYKRKLMAPALKALTAAAAAPEGQADYRTQLYLARTAAQLTRLEQAFPAARRAVELAPGEDEEARARALVEELEGQFGGVTFDRDPDQKTELVQTFIHLKDVGGLINARKKQVFLETQTRFRSTKVGLPITIYLPFGKYTANGAPFEVKQGETAQARLYLLGEEDEGLAWWWYAGIAGAVAGGAAVAVALLLAEDPEPQQSARIEPLPFLPQP